MVRAFMLCLRRRLRRSGPVQIALILGLWGIGEGLSRGLRLPVPGGVLGMMLALSLLVSGSVSVLSLRRGAQWLLGDMLLFFVPTVLVLLDHREFLGVLGLKLLVVIVCGTLSVMAATALTVDVYYHWRLKRHVVREAPAR